MITFSDIQDAYLFVSADSYGMNTAFLLKDTGQILYGSGMGGIDEIGDAELDSDTCVEILHKKDLNLGKPLVFDFVKAYLPNEFKRVHRMFRSRGVYGRCKDFLESKVLLKTWYEFENRREEQALRRWCQENEIELSDEPDAK